jgi:hypothetical protein
LGARHALWGTALLLALAAGCQLVVSLDDLNDRKCKADEKSCKNRCVSLTDPATGCAAVNTCSPCVLTHATALCNDVGACAIAACIGHYGDCDPAAEGCETDFVHDRKNCGFCKNECVIANGFPGCSASHCAVAGCYEGWDDCNRDWHDGCERQLGTSTDCAGCDLACAPGTSCVENLCR